MSVSITYNVPTNLQLPRTPPAGLPDVVVPAFNEVYQVMNNFALSLTVDCGVGSRAASQWEALKGNASTVLANNVSRFYVEASEPLAFGDIISLHNVAGEIRVRLANATDNTKPADGFCNAIAGIAAGSSGEVILAHGVLPASGLVIGTRYFLSLVSGVMTPVAPVAAGNIEQYLGVALSSEALYFNCGYWIQH